MDITAGNELNTELSQRPALAPSVIGSLEILQMGRQELDLRIKNELCENPVLEAGGPRGERQADLQALAREIAEEESYGDGDESMPGGEDPERRDYLALATEGETLRESLLMQLRFTDQDATHKRIGEYIIETLGEDGIMKMDAREIADALGISEEEAMREIGIIRNFDPPGVCAGDRVECLLLQIRRRGDTDADDYERLLRGQADRIIKGDLDGAARAMGRTREEIDEMMDLIRTLETSPAAGFAGGGEIAYTIPDVSIEGRPDQPEISAVDEGIPELRISSYYLKLLDRAKAEGEAEVVEYLNDRIESAARLLEAIERRREMITDLANCIVRYQSGFFEGGVSRMKPLTMKAAAEKLGVSVSTVSRAANSKYMQTERGVFPFRYFFSGGVTDASGRGISSESIKARIREIIASEDSERPLSDRRIAEMLNEEGLLISRRTVAKYREEAGIAASSGRKHNSAR
ncbi:MAG: RNA polymerase factor sigma-54 [Anaerovoracaceae bacterium]|nr:RNA polymerase factor sigma-54 [Anaerovoracaceae bacterium]